MAADQKTQKYDRQLRLWQGHGQSALENASVCLIGSSAVGTEILKNLVLPGIGRFTVVDAAKVALQDTTNNFFVTGESVGRPRAKVVTELLSELNEDADGHFVEEDLESLLQHNATFFHQFTVVLVTGLVKEEHLLALADVCWNAPRNVPLFVIKMAGFASQVSLYIREHTVVEAHPDNAKDLRLDAPWAELVAHVDAMPAFQDMDTLTYTHVPYVCILLRCLKLWQDEQGKALPATSEEKRSFRELVSSGVRHDVQDSENWDEAVANAYAVYSPSGRPSSDLQAVFDDAKCTESLSPNADLDNFWIIARAVKRFVESEGQGNCPLSGKLPDMKADTQGYIALQTIYRQRAKADAAAVKAHVASILSQLARPADSIAEAEIDAFCNNSRFVRVIRTRSLQEEQAASRADLAYCLQDPDDLFVLHVLFRAQDAFYSEHKRMPDCFSSASTTGEHPDDVDTDVPALKSCVRQVLQQMDLAAAASTASAVDDWVQEFTRASSAELHNIAALIGGITAQEVIKIITRQYTPMCSTMLFNGIKSTSTVLKL
ncbi:hypothetical protein RI367_005357 [Sorochytrium milnesiophthora]